MRNPKLDRHSLMALKRLERMERKNYRNPYLRQLATMLIMNAALIGFCILLVLALMLSTGEI